MALFNRLLIRSSPVIGIDSLIYVGSDDGYLYAIFPNGNLHWKKPSGSGIACSPTISSNGNIYIGSSDSYLYSYNSGGDIKWTYRTNGGIFSSPSISSDSIIYFGSGDGYLYAIKGSGTLTNAPWSKFRHDIQNTGRFYGP